MESIDRSPVMLTLLCHFMTYFICCQGTCAPGYYLKNSTLVCTYCPRGTYKPLAGDEPGCTQCPQSIEGRPRVTLYAAATSQDQCFTWPEIEDFGPVFGPLSGGTVVRVSLKHWEKYNVTFILMANSVCNITAHRSNNMTVSCLTSKVLAPKQGVAKLTFSSDTMLVSNKTFEYRPDPVVTSIDDMRSFISGGLQVKVYGEHFDSVAQIYFIVTRISHGVTKIFSEPCDMVTPELLHCRTPNVGVGLIHHLFNDISTSSRTPQNRRKREVTPPTFNDDNNEFYAGMQMDGMEAYTNISSALPGYGQMMVYPDPVFYEFEEEGNLKLHNPQDSSFLDVKGMHLNYACDIEDISVTIGQGVCNVTYLATNRLSCAPPTTQPEPDATGHGAGRTPRVTVYVGYLVFFIGYLKYHVPGEEPDIPVNTTEEGTEVFIGALVGGILSLLLLIILIVMILVLCKRNRHGRKDIKHLGGSQHGLNSADPPRYIERKPSVLTNVVCTDISLKNGSVQPVIYDDTDITHNKSRQREMSVTISPPDTPGNLSMISEGPNFPVYLNSTDLTAEKDVLSQLDESLMINVEECMIESECLTLGDIIGVGYFGKVYKGFLKQDQNETVVAVKTIQGSHFSLKEVGGFLEEAVMMKDFNHRNVLSLIGIVMKDSRPLVVLPYMEHGDLKSYIKDPSKSFKVRELLEFGQQVATGMSYLASQKFVHRDLATRNCMLNTEQVVKIADFGLSRDVYKSDYYRVEDKHRPLPVRWMAVESLTSGVFSAKSDVWSFGVTLWELLTRGCSPYPDVDTFNIKAYVLSGRRLSQPDHAPDEVYELMCQCWLEEVDERPSFDELKNNISDILSEDEDCRHDYAKLVLVS